MADHAKPTATSLYAAFVSEMKGRFDDLCRFLDPATTTPTNLPTNSVAWDSASKTWKKWTGTAWSSLCDVFGISISGNAGSATKLASPRVLSLYGDATASISFDGTADTTAVLTLANTGITAGTYRSVTVDAQGRATGGSNPTTLAGYGITDAVPSTDASAEPAASKLPRSRASGVLDTGWLDPAIARELRLLALGINPTLDLDFGRQQYRRYNAAKGLETLADPFASFITFTRATTATYFGPDGTLRTAAINEPRIDHNPLTGECLGLLAEEQRTNLLLGSADPATQSVTVTAQAYTLSFYGTGTVTLSGAYAGTLPGSGTFPTRSILKFTPSAGSLTLTIVGSVQYGQLEAGGYATSYIDTGGSAATRSGDLASITGTNFGSWYTQKEWSIVSSVFSHVLVNEDNGQQRLFYISDGSTSYMYCGVNKTTSAGFFDAAIGGVLQGSSVPPSSWRNNRLRVAIGFSNGVGYETASNGSAGTVKAVAAQFPTMDQMTISSLGGPLSGYVSRIIFYPRRLSSAQLLELSK